jgi:hypothetical protein
MPWTGEFSPGQLGDAALIATLTTVFDHAGNRDEIVEAIRSSWFTSSAAKRAANPAAQRKQQRTRAGNVLNGMQNYGLVDETYRLTELGQELLVEDNDDRRNRMFVGFLLKHRRGLELLDVVRDLTERGVSITNDALRKELRSRGYKVTTNSGDAGKLRQWLGRAGVVNDKWEINEARLAEITGTTLTVVAEWQSLSKVQRAFLATIRRLSETRGKAPIPSPELLDFVLDEHGAIFDEGQVRKVYEALSRGDWITHSVKPSGRGGKGGLIAATDKLIEVDFELLVGFRPGHLPADLRAVLTTPLEEIYADLKSKDDHVKGIALELLAVNMASDLGLLPLRMRIRGIRTGGAEVDLVAEGAHLHFSRWLFQCKNTKSVDVGVLAKEVGMATLLQSQVIVIATTGTVSKTVITYAERVSETTPFQVVLADRAVLEEYQVGGAMALRQRFRQSARTAMQHKRPQVLETLEELSEDES